MKRFFQKNTITDIQQALCSAYIFYISFIFIFCYHNNYIDLTITKRLSYLIGSSIFCALMLFLMICKFLLVSHTWKFSSPPLQLLLIGMLAAWGIGLIICSNSYESFWGTTHKCTGLLLYILGVISILLLGAYLEWKQVLTYFFFTSSTLLCLLQVLNRWEIDPLHMYRNLIWYEYPQFISTLGNTNYNGAFDCLVIGIMMTLFFQCSDFKKMVFYGLGLCIAFAGAICTVSDVVFVCIAAVFAVLTGFAILSPIKLFKIWSMLILFTIPCCIFPHFFHNREEELFIWGITGTIFDGQYLKYQVCIVAGLGVLLLLFYSLISKNRNMIFLIYKIMVLSVIALVLFLLILANSTLFLAEYDPFLSHLRISGSWGNDRGDLWQRMMTLFVQAPLVNKSFGYGFNNVFEALETIQLGVRAEEQISDAHNIYFNTLITSGIVGCILWAAFIGILFYRAIRMIQQKKDHGIYVLIGLLCILIQGLVIGSQIITTPIILTEFGVFYSLVVTHPLDE